MPAYPNQNETWEIESIDSKRNNIVLKKGNSKLELYAVIPPPPRWSAGDKIGKPEKREYVRSDIIIKIENKTKGGKIDAHALKGSDDIMEYLGLTEKMEYLNLYKNLRIAAIKFPDMLLNDGSKWCFPPGMMAPSAGWMVDDIINVELMEVSLRKDEKKLIHKIINKTREKQEGGAYLSNSSYWNMKSMNEYNIMKGRRKGTIDDSYPYEIKLGDKYPDEWLKREYKIREILLDYEYDDEKDMELKYNSIVVADSSPGGSIWRMFHFDLSINNFRRWKEGQTVRISKRESRMTTYWIENLDILNSQIGGSFMGWAEFKF